MPTQMACGALVDPDSSGRFSLLLRLTSERAKGVRTTRCIYPPRYNLHMRTFPFLLLALLCVSVDAAAGTIYKCREAGGVVSYQDDPCPGRQIGRLSTSAPAPRAPVSRSSAASPAAEVKAPPRASVRTVRPAFRCRRPDGGEYYSGEAHGRRTLADRPAGGALPALIPGAPAAPPGKMWVEDQCVAATRAEMCQYYGQAIADVEAALQQQRGDARLERERKRLIAIRNNRCD